MIYPYFVYTASSRSTRALPWLTSILLLFVIYHVALSSYETNIPHNADEQRSARDITLVVASQKRDNVSWLYTAFPEWHKEVYVVDDPGGMRGVQLNKGREAMVYLTYDIMGSLRLSI